MTNNLDTLATALYAATGDLLKQRPDLAPWRPAVGIPPQLTDAELVTLAMMQAMLGFTSEARWLRYARAHLRHLFPYLPQQPGYNKRLRKAADLLRHVTRILATSTSVWSDDVWIVDSTPVECGRSRETVKRSDLAGWAEYGYCASHSRFFWGLRLHLICTLQGLPIAFAGHLNLEQHRGRTPRGVITRVLQRILALAAVIWHNDATGRDTLRSLTTYVH
ncbi:hypothetical protein [Streptomyces sp. AGS-58]|uniref:hypothetical protein n=1 Tax=unclassified Streptomyces TaxID=2593676 RepID=UPI0035A2A830